MPSAIGSPAVEWKLISGWFSVSKNSAEVRWASRCWSPVSTLATWTVPDSFGASLVASTVPGELAEFAAHGRDAHVAHLEADARVRGVDVVGAGGNRLE